MCIRKSSHSLLIGEVLPILGASGMLICQGGRKQTNLKDARGSSTFVG
jgi:hypothetical protein